MPEYLSPGVYVEEIEIGGKPVEGGSINEYRRLLGSNGTRPYNA